MADYCKQCSERIFGQDFGELKGFSSPQDTADEKYVSVLCEGCGPIQVDHEGKCVSPDCPRGHGKLKV